MPLREPAPIVPAEELGRVHFIGVGGVSMSGIARLLAERGVQVTGCDREESPALDPVRAAGVEVLIGHDPSHLEGIQSVVFNSAITASNRAELDAVAERGLRSLHRSTALASLMTGKRGVGVSGTHGKTSTSGAVVAAMGALDPSYAVGSTLATTGTGAATGAGEWFVIEADESDGSFLQYDLEIAVVTNIEADHLDNWGTPESYAQGFRRFATTAGLRVLICSGDDAGTRALAAEVRQGEGPRVLTYGESPDCDLVLSDVEEGSGPGRGASARLRCQGVQDTMRLQVPGRHSVHNAAAAYLAAREAGLDHATALAGVQTFQGTARRFQLVGQADGVHVIDDYSHHPTEVRAALSSARAFAGEGRVLLVFQPHLFSRTRDFAEEFGEALAAADHVVLTDIYPAREEPIEGVTSQLVVDACRRAGTEAELVGPLDDVADRLAQIARPGDIVVTVGAGSITRVGPQLLALLEERA